MGIDKLEDTLRRAHDRIGAIARSLSTVAAYCPGCETELQIVDGKKMLSVGDELRKLQHDLWLALVDIDIERNRQ